MIRVVRHFALRHLRKMRFLPSWLYVHIHYEYFSGKKLNLKAPKDFNEKIEWYKVYFRPKILNVLVDKYAVRNYVKEKVGLKYLNELIGVYTKGEDIIFDELPSKFIIKATHVNNCHLIVRDKTLLNKKGVMDTCNKWLKKNQYYRKGQEWAYKDVQPRIIIEKLLEEPDRSALTDYKFYCFNGTPKFIDVHMDREANHKQGCYDLEFNKLPFGKSTSYKSIDESLKKPINLEQMITIASKLASNFPFVRVDLYSLEGKTIFGELTFYPSDARKEFYPSEYNKLIGDYFILPKLEKKRKTITFFQA